MRVIGQGARDLLEVLLPRAVLLPAASWLLADGERLHAPISSAVTFEAVTRSDDSRRHLVEGGTLATTEPSFSQPKMPESS